ncbi:unnamed protein product [Aureobasidium uvarum]|uniref:Uncharacterized protein n=1 Tax=Aureobasidium uvarum TaxID=2773716 RepID=A0A9N8KIC1_9PEZI|nr:unnamed protein product [Aureobasidium uvarum]
MSKLRLSSLYCLSFSTSLQHNCQFVWAGEAPRNKREGEAWEEWQKPLPEKTDVRNFDNAKVERAKAAARDIHQERAQHSGDSDQ